MKKSLFIIAASVLVLLYMNFYSMPMVLKNLNLLSFINFDNRLLDLRYQGYQKQDVLLFFELLGPQGRHDYQTIQLPIDMLYPLLFAIGYSSFFSYYLRSKYCLLKLKKYTFAFLSLPIISAVMDWSENLNTYFMLQRFPSIDIESVFLGSNFTQLKFLFILITLLIFTAMITHLIILQVRWILSDRNIQSKF